MNIVSLMLIVSALFVGTPQQPQTFTKKLTYNTIKDQPVEVSGFTTEGRKIDPNVSFQSKGANIEWLKNFSFDVKNTSSQPIQYVSLNLVVKYNDLKSLPCVYTLLKGESVGPNNKPFGKKISFFPGDSIKFEISEAIYTDLVNFLNTDGYKVEDIATVALVVHQVEFPDRTL